MTVRTYPELQQLLATNGTKDISAADVRDFLDSVATDRLNTDTLAVGSYTTTVAYTPATVNITPASSSRFDILADGSVNFKAKGLYNTIYYMVVDASAIANNQAVYLQMWLDNGIDPIAPNSLESAGIKTNRSNDIILRVSTENPIADGENFTIKPYMSSDGVGTDTLTIKQLYVSVRSIPVIKT